MSELLDHSYDWRAEPAWWSQNTRASGLYRCLRGLAARRLRRERRDHTLQPTALAHEAYLRLIRRRDLRPDSTRDVVAAAVQEIRRVLIDHARAKGRRKRGGELVRHPLTEGVPAPCAPDPFDLDGAISRLEQVAPRAAQTVQLRFFAGLSLTEIAALLDVTTRTVERDWQFARAWLYRDLNENQRRAG